MAVLSRTIASLFSLAALAAATCDNSTLNTTSWYYDITTYPKTIAEIANETGRGLCDIGRWNVMADVTIIPNIGQTIYIPPQVCDPDNTSCLLPDTNSTRECIYGGPRLYYTVNGDTYEIIAKRLDISLASLWEDAEGVNSTTDVLEPGQFIKVPLCSPSQCVIQPYTFDWGVYKDLADEYNTTVGQIMMLSPTYNYSTSVSEGESGPSIDLPINCTVLSSNITAIY